ncbi:unnamed protein product [Caenorhabditis brenneri]
MNKNRATCPNRLACYWKFGHGISSIIQSRFPRQSSLQIFLYEKAKKNFQLLSGKKTQSDGNALIDLSLQLRIKEFDHKSCSNPQNIRIVNLLLLLQQV